MAQELGPAASSELEQSIIYNEESISFSQFVEEENDEDGSTHEDSDDEEDDGEDGEGDYVGRADKPYNPESDANSKFSFPKSKRIKLNIEAFYTRLWGGREAYREFYQNWMDGILKVNKLKLHQFQLHYHQDLKKRRIEITCRHPTDHDDNDPTVKKLLGYMLFTWPLRNNPNKEGVLEMCNFNASLYERNFKLGNTTKANDKDQAGEHGEGFKIAAMVLRRHPQNYSVRAMASERFIDFKFSGKGEIAACVSSLKTKKKERDLAEFEELSDNGKCRPLKPKVWEDVTFIIGVQRKVKDARGRQCPTSRIPLATFEDWLSVTTHVKPPKQRFQTPYGTLILEEAYINKMYLRGLLLPNGSSSRHKYKYGYDFPEGKTNRDREGLKSSGQREQMITNIWSFAICENLEFMKMYCGLLLTPQDSRSADVFCAEDYLNKDDILRIWGFLKLDSGLNDAFYYCEGKDREDAAMIRKHLDLEPRAVPKHLWKALRQHDSVNIRTFSEHREHLFLEREEVPIEDNPFSSHMRYLLRACLLAHHSTSDKRFVIVDGGQLGLNSYYDKTEKTWKLDKKLFNVLDLRTWVYCDASKVQLHESSDNYIFLWDRPVIEVYGRMIDDLTYADLNLATNDADETDKASGKSEGDLRKEADERRRWLEGMVSELLPSVPRGLKITPTSKGRELEVSWQSAESMAVCKISAGMQRVTLHRHVSCHAKASDSLFDADQECDCPWQDVALDVQGHVFQELDETEKYFPMVARKTSRAIYGKPPSSCFPLPPIDPSLDMDIDDFDEPADNLSYNGSMRGPSTAPSTGGPPSSTLRRKTPILSGQGASRLSSQSNEELPDRTQAQGVRNHLPPVPQTYTYKRGNFPLPANHADLSFGISRDWYSAKQLGGEQGDAIIGIISKKRKTPPDDAEEAPVRRHRQPTVVSIASDDESSD